jgi:hypothetical protein
MSEKKFWNNKYRQGGISGRGSIGFYRNWKWNQIAFICGTNFRSVVDVGCGDLSFWKHPIANKILRGQGFKYIGIDISDFIIEQNRKTFPEGKFIVAPAHFKQPGIYGSLVLCMDVLFHMMDDGEYEMALQTLCNYTNQYLAIYTWQKNPFEGLNTVTDGISQYFRKLGDSRATFTRNNLNLVHAVRSPYDPFGKLYFFRRTIY